MKATILTATRNRSESLREMLGHLARLDVPSDTNVEAIVADNDSSDSTVRIVDEAARSNPFPLRYILERRKGKAAALNAAVRAASGDVLLFLDDDCMPDPDWLAAHLRELGTIGGPAIVGGRVELSDPTDYPIAILTSRERVAITSAVEVCRPRIMGCNMSMPRTIMESIGDFDERLGPGKTSGDDVDILFRAYKRGAGIVYSPEPVVYHHHRRKCQADADKLLIRYYTGKGALFCKYAGDAEMQRVAYWTLGPIIVRALRGALRGQPTREQRQLLRAVGDGAMFMLRHRRATGRRDTEMEAVTHHE